MIQYLDEQNSIKLTKDQFAVVLQLTLDSMLEEKIIIINGFRGAGLFPFGSKHVNLDVLKKKK